MIRKTVECNRNRSIEKTPQNQTEYLSVRGFRTANLNVYALKSSRYLHVYPLVILYFFFLKKGLLSSKKEEYVSKRVFL